MTPVKPHRIAVPLLTLLLLSPALHAAPADYVNPNDQQRDWQRKQQLQEKIDRELEEQRWRAARQEREKQELEKQEQQRKAKTSDETDDSPTEGQDN